MLAPLFFASIGFAIVSVSIFCESWYPAVHSLRVRRHTVVGEHSSSLYQQPFRSLWRITILWKGVLYAILMCAAKLTVGLPIIIYSVFWHTEEDSSLNHRDRHWSMLQGSHSRNSIPLHHLPSRQAQDPCTSQHTTTPPPQPSATTNMHSPTQPHLSPTNVHPPYAPPARSLLTRARSALGPAAFIGVAMVSRGEIGLLVA